MSAVGWDLPELEQAARLVLEEENEREKGEAAAATPGEREANQMTQPDATIEKLSTNLENIQLSPTCTVADCVATTIDLSAKADADSGATDPVLPSCCGAASIKLSSSCSPAQPDKPLIEEVDQQLQTGSSGSESSSGEEENSHSTDSSETTKSSSCKSDT